MNHPRSISGCTIAALLAFAASATAQSQLVQGEVLLTLGDPIAAVPGATCGGSGALAQPVIDQAGNVLFRSRMIGGGVVATNDRAYFLGRTNGQLQMILRSGDNDPTISNQLGIGTTLNTASGTGIGGSPRIAPYGNILMFGCSLSGPTIVATGTAATGNNSTALLWGQPGGFSVLEIGRAHV